MSLKEAVVDGGDDSEKGYGCLFRVRGDGVGEEGGGETAPHVVCIEGEHELDGAACEKRGEDCIDCAVNVVERQAMKETVLWRVVPCPEKRFGLCSEYRLREEDAFLREIIRWKSNGSELRCTEEGRRGLAHTGLLVVPLV